MNQEEMIAKFLESNKVTVCPDEDRVGNGQSRVNNQNGRSRLDGFNKRTLSKICTNCGESFYVDNSNGCMSKKIENATTCSLCRKKESVTKAKDHQKVVEYGSLKNYKRYKELKEKISYIYHKKLNKEKTEKLQEMVDYLEELITIKEIATMATRLEDIRIELSSRVTDNWDDWDTPLGVY